MFERRGMTAADVKYVEKSFELMAEVVAERLNEQTERIKALERDVAKLQAEPRKSLARKIMEKRNA